MVIKAIFGAISLVLFSLAASVDAGSPVWKVSKHANHLYLGGTFHVLSPADHPLPAQFDYAYQRASHVILETDTAALESPEFLQKTLLAMTYSDGRTLQGALRPATYDALHKYLQSRGLQAASFAMFTPTGVALSIQMLEYQLLGMTKDAGVDKVFSVKARRDGKKLGQLETPEAQLAFLAKMGEGKENEIILHTLNEVESLPTKMAELKAAWRSGDNRYLEKIAMTDIKKEFPAMYEILLKNRNDAWMPKIEAMLRDGQIELVLVGAMHLAGQDGLLRQLRGRGYAVENL